MENIENNIHSSKSSEKTDSFETVDQPEMVTSRDQRILTKICHKIGESKARLAGMRRMERDGITFDSIENFLRSNSEKKRGNNTQGDDEREVVKLLMNNKNRNEKENLRRLR